MQDPVAHVDRYLPRYFIDSLRTAAPKVQAQTKLTRYTVQRLAGGCVVYWVGRRETGELHDARTRQEPPSQRFNTGLWDNE